MAAKINGKSEPRSYVSKAGKGRQGYERSMISPALWNNIENLELGGAGRESVFLAGLARENGWSKEHTASVVREYRRFVYLGMLSGSPVSPSDAVDQVWRNHLTFTGHYWGEFTRVLGNPLHYRAIDIDEAEIGPFTRDYEELVQLYRQEFNCDPPSGLWPGAADRLREAKRTARVNLDEKFILSKPDPHTMRSLGSFAGVAAFPLSVLGYALAQSSSGARNFLPDVAWLVVAALAVMIAVFGCLVWRNEIRARNETAKASRSSVAAHR